MVLFKTILLSILLSIPLSVVVTGYPTPSDITEVERRDTTVIYIFRYSIRFQNAGSSQYFHVKRRNGQIKWPKNTPHDVILQVGEHRPAFHAIRNDESDAQKNKRYPFEASLSATGGTMLLGVELGTITRQPWEPGEKIPFDLLKIELQEEIPFTGRFDYIRNAMSRLYSKREISAYPEGYQEWMTRLCKQEAEQWEKDWMELFWKQYGKACGASASEEQEVYRWRLHRLLHNNCPAYSQHRGQNPESPPSLDTLVEDAKELCGLDLSTQN
ncbi:hypothetical protein EV361DRAFT_123774 [Lentinula raphanica]|uniref:Uncharacterized protein n=1 Tax=Lentinula raphanica TaxID=153919 RepID=A0AA38P2G1_9AGAR|nr:hypothetical protein F5878DRAFT_328885 [Lentinula raphanica]KAJ3972668.1 hypothetical protein EV361DRAFT_123774 [Lentinula raphanica]